MREAEDRRRDLERQHAEVLSQLERRQSAGPGAIKASASATASAVAPASASSTSTSDGETIETLQSKIRELEKKAALQSVRHEELLLEMAVIKRSAGAAAGSTGAAVPGNGLVANLPVDHTKLDTGSPAPDVTSPPLSSAPSTPLPSSGHSLMTSSTNTTVSNTSRPAAPSSNLEIDRIMAKIEQDNRILAELDKTRSTIGLPSTVGLNTHHGLPYGTGTMGVTGVTGVTGVAGLPLLPSANRGLPGTVGAPLTTTSTLGTYLPLTSSSTTTAAAAVAAAAAAAAGSGGYSNRIAPAIPPAIVASQYDVDRLYSGLEGQHLPAQQGGKILDMLEIPGKGRCCVYIARYSYDPFTQSPNENPEAELAIHAGDYVLVWGNMDEDGFYDGELVDGRRGLVPGNYIQKLVGEDLLDFHQNLLRDCDDCVSTTVPQDLDFSMGHECGGIFDDGMCLSKRDYTYMDLDEMLDEEEEMDQSGDGPVPAPKQLTLERQLNKSVLIGWNHPDNCPPGAIESYLLYVDGVLKASVKATERTRALVEGVDSSRPHRISVRSITPNHRTSRDAACTMVIGKDVPMGPTRVKATHVTSTSAVICWLPANSNHQHVVCVNNVELRTVKPGVYRHTITGLAPDTLYRVTVRAKNIRAARFQDKEHPGLEHTSCHIDFMTLPKGLPDPPSDIQVEPGPQDGTVLVTWLPVATAVTPGAPGVPALPGVAASNGALITGYAVYADGKKVTDVDSPTGDHALIDIGKLMGLNPRQVTVRTKSRDAQSADSPPTPIPPSILRGRGHLKDGGQHGVPGSGMVGSGQAGIGMQNRGYYKGAQQQSERGATVDQYGQVVIDPDENLSDKEVYPSNHLPIPAIEITKDSTSEDDYEHRRHHVVGPGGVGPSGGVGGQGQRGYEHVQTHRAPPRSHAERGRPPPPPHERRMHRDERDQYYGQHRGAPHGYRPGPQTGHPGGPPQGPGLGQRGRPDQGGPAAEAAAQQKARDRRVRWFVGLVDYDPRTMSPNPDAFEEELPFSEGERIKVFGEKDADGFYWGEVRGKRGFIPHNVVTEEAPEESQDGWGRRDRWGDTYASMPVKKMVALYDYDPQELSPNVDAEQVELSFRTGDVIYVYGDMDDDGFYMGELDGVRGLVPSNFLTEPRDEYLNGGDGTVRGLQRAGVGPGAGPRGRGGPERGHGPGARGPSPPPREGMSMNRMDARDRRKGPGSFPEGERRSGARSAKW